MSELVIAEKSEIVAIADQLRALVSKTEDMSLGEMAAEVSNANVNKTDILSALTEKGVDATGAGLADIAALVAGIESGESVTLPYGVEEIIVTEIVPAEDITSDYDIPIMLPSSSEYNIRMFIFMNEIKHEDYLPEKIVLAGYYDNCNIGSSASESRRVGLITTSNGTTGTSSYNIVSPYYSGKPNSSIHLFGNSSRKFAAGKRYCCVAFIRRDDT